MICFFCVVLSFCLAVAVPSGVSISDLVSHLKTLENQPQDPRVNFELGLTYQLLADGDANVVNSDAEAVAGAGAILSLGQEGLRSKAIFYYQACLAEDPRNADALSNIAFLLESFLLETGNNPSDENATASILDLYERATSSDPTHFQSHLNYGLLLRRLGRHQDALTVFDRGLLSHPSSTVLAFERAFTMELLGEYKMAISIYEEILSAQPNHTKGLLNLAALYHERFFIEDAIDIYSRALATVSSYQKDCLRYLQQENDLFTGGVPSPFSFADHVNVTSCLCPSEDDVILISKILRNMGSAFSHRGRYTEAIECYNDVVALLHKCEGNSQPSKQLLITSVNLFLSSKAGSFFSAWDWLDSLIQYIEFHLEDGDPALQPFETLGLPVSRSWKKKIATFYSNNGIDSKLPIKHYRPPNQAIDDTHKMRLGFMSRDFGNHPTTFLFEGIVVANHSAPIETAVYSYGPDDGSEARRSIVQRSGESADGGAFFDISALSHDDAIRVVCDDRPDIIFDMQGFTLGARPQLIASRCAGLQVNFLAYPGTSGASYIDYVIVDRFVAAIERAEEEFTEKLAILPRSYQPNYFVEPFPIPVRGSIEWKELRAKENLSTSTSAFVFANLNKQDKLDPESFSAMMQCLSQVPESVLWLLEPSGREGVDIVKKNLCSMAEKAGVSPDRLVFAKRVDRMDHIRRMAAGDLFLDTFLYGAHTTATDALRGGLPLLTLAGDSFSSRVGMSLLHGMNSKKAPSLITYSIPEFVDVAVEIATAQREHTINFRFPDAKSIGTRLIEPDGQTDHHELFDWRSYSRDLDDLSKMMMEVKHLGLGNMHIVMTK